MPLSRASILFLPALFSPVTTLADNVKLVVMPPLLWLSNGSHSHYRARVESVLHALLQQGGEGGLNSYRYTNNKVC